MTKTYYIDESGFILGGIPLEVKELEKHEKRKDEVQNLPYLSKCAVCNTSIKPSRMKAHLRRVHNITDTAQEKNNPHPTKVNNNKPNSLASTKPIPKAKSKIIRAITPIQGIRCDICKAIIPSYEFSNHMGTHFPKISSSSDGSTCCPVCNVKLNPKNLKKHLTKVHNTHASPAYIPVKSIAIKKNNTVKKLNSVVTKKRQVIRSSSITKKGQPSIILESLEQSFDEKIDGSKGLGHMRRESDGKFGSYPLHDDYGDESEP